MSVARPSDALELYVEIARLIAGDDAPPWLAKHFKRWAGSLFLDRHIQTGQPTKSEMKKELQSVEEAAAQLSFSLSELKIREFLEAGSLGPIDYIGTLTRCLDDIADRAARAMNSDALSRPDGITRPGPGPALPPGVTSPQGYCALLIAEAWREFHGSYPALGSRNAGEAADLLWRAAGGDHKGWGSDPINAWRHHFARAQESEAFGLRAEYRRVLQEAARHAQRQLDSWAIAPPAPATN